MPHTPKARDHLAERCGKSSAHTATLWHDLCLGEWGRWVGHWWYLPQYLTFESQFPCLQNKNEKDTPGQRVVKAILGDICSLPAPALWASLVWIRVEHSLVSSWVSSVTTHPSYPLLFLQITKIFAQLQSFRTSLSVLQRPGQRLWALECTLCFLPGLALPLPGYGCRPRELDKQAAPFASLHWHDIAFPSRKDLALSYCVSCFKHSFKCPFWILGRNMPKCKQWLLLVAGLRE